MSEIIALESMEFFKNIFNECDKDKDGFITIEELRDLIETEEYGKDIPVHIVQRIHSLHDLNKDRRLNYDEFFNMITNPKLQTIFGRYMTRYINLIVPKRHNGFYEEEYSCYPPAVGMIVISLLDIIIFFIDEYLDHGSTNNASGPIASALRYEPGQRREIWRYITYMFVHMGLLHLIMNLLVQIVLGLPLEMVHKWRRVLVVYIAGVLAGSLGTSIVSPKIRLVGASGGVYSLITAHVASILMNWREMSYPIVQFLAFIIYILCDIGSDFYNNSLHKQIIYAAHFSGAVAGLLVGINILRNFNKTRLETFIWWFSIILFITLMAICILLNLTLRDYFNEETYN